MPVDLTWHHQWVHHPFPYNCRTTPETGEQFSMPICSVLSCPGIADTISLWELHVNQAVAAIISGFNYKSYHCWRSIVNFRCLVSSYPDSVYPIFGLHVSRFYSVLTTVKDIKRKMGSDKSWKWHLTEMFAYFSRPNVNNSAAKWHLVSFIWAFLWF